MSSSSSSVFDSLYALIPPNPYNNLVTRPLVDEQKEIFSPDEAPSAFAQFKAVNSEILELSKEIREIKHSMKDEKDTDKLLQKSRKLSDFRILLFRTRVTQDTLHLKLDLFVEEHKKAITRQADEILSYMKQVGNSTDLQFFENEQYFERERQQTEPIPYLGFYFSPGTNEYISPIKYTEEELKGIIVQYINDFSKFMTDPTGNNTRVIVEYNDSPLAQQYVAIMWSDIKTKHTMDCRKIQLIYNAYDVVLIEGSPIAKAIEKYGFLSDRNNWPVDPSFVIQQKAQFQMKVREQRQ